MCKGELVKVNLIRPDEHSKRSYIGNLIGLDNGIVNIKTDDGQLSFDKKAISSVCLKFDENDFKAVSYTHLDVYKRQNETRPNSF